MIVNFSVQNFGSIKDKQILSFEADKSAHLENAYIVNINGQRILKLALIYGANASGKTTILNALEFLGGMVLNPESKKTSELQFRPFLFDTDTPNQNSIISIEFFHKNIKYFYEIVFNKIAIVREELYFYNPNKASVYKRKTNLENQFTEIGFGSKFSKNKTFGKTLEANTLWNNTVLGGYLKTNINFHELQEVIDWFKNYLRPLINTKTELKEFITSQIHNNEISKNDVVNILKKADFNISDIIIKEEEKEIPDGFIEFLKRQVKTPNDDINELEKKGKITAVNVEFEHTVNNTSYSLPFEEESQGTKRYYGFSGLLALLIKQSTVFPIDELESSLHPDLYLHFLLSFLLNAKTSQIIATTHNREILDNKDIFRNDAIWFTDKGENGATELYSLADFDSSVIRDTTNILNAYKSGKLSGTPNLGDTFIDLNL
ncbi:ATPase/GTPase, AAA15 family [Flexibacter flexilis DSM 6793]|uniref:ATPase/GTPase, AAA15 family n=1 Tax=Flexibacter flexilis DSM 6793 TaxID=927664 RepID=A0A1I1I9X3_9BACT|nr:ATP-binding protein [Flexibacter flexilis]SFC31078.1 ATPase/GTPase, AAA15 family [Flexibacter flexilis DSM 6793]